jgi:hypothetical protein
MQSKQSLGDGDVQRNGRRLLSAATANNAHAQRSVVHLSAAPKPLHRQQKLPAQSKQAPGRLSATRCVNTWTSYA